MDKQKLAEEVTAESERLLRKRAAERGEDTSVPNWLFTAFAVGILDGTLQEAIRNVMAKQ